MCNPEYFDVIFRINPWMHPHSVNKKLAKEQWNTLFSKYKGHGVNIHVVNSVPEYPDMVFTTDQGFVYNNNFILSNFRFPERQGESKYYKPILEQLGFNMINLPEDIFLEGGDILKANDNLFFIGYGFRTSSKTPEYIKNLLDVKTVGLKLIDEKYYHLDTCFFILDSDTVFFYPEAFSKSSVLKVEEHFKNIFTLSEKEILNFVANSVRIDNTVFMQKGNPLFTKKIKELGYDTEVVDLSEFQKSGGGIHCLTLPIY